MKTIPADDRQQTSYTFKYTGLQKVWFQISCLTERRFRKADHV